MRLKCILEVVRRAPPGGLVALAVYLAASATVTCPSRLAHRFGCHVVGQRRPQPSDVTPPAGNRDRQSRQPADPMPAILVPSLSGPADNLPDNKIVATDRAFWDDSWANTEGPNR